MVFPVLLIVLLSFLAGVLTLLFIQWTVIQNVLFGKEDLLGDMPQPEVKRFSLPEVFKCMIDNEDYKNKTESWLSVNIIIQFLFKEWKDSSVVRRFFMRKITREFEDFLQNTAAGKFLENITVKDLSLGVECPIMKDIKLSNVVLNPVHGHIQEVDIEMFIDYNGGCELFIEADTVLGKSAALAIKMIKLEGAGRLQLTQIPYSHWSFSFLEPPLSNFDVKSQFIPQITSLIISQIRRVLKKRHTLPNYKIRYKPFCLAPEMRHSNFTKAHDFQIHGNKLYNGYLCVNVVECSRLVETPSNSLLYCTLAIDSCAWVELVSSQSSSWITQDIELQGLKTLKGSNQCLGILLKQEFILDKYDYFVVVEMIVPNSPAAAVDIKKNDILVTIGGVRVTTVNHAAKLFKQTGDKFVMRTERRSNLRSSHSQEFLNKDFKVNEDILSVQDDEISQDENEFISYSLKEVPDNQKKPISLHKQLFQKKQDSPKLSRKKSDEISSDLKSSRKPNDGGINHKYFRHLASSESGSFSNSPSQPTDDECGLSCGAESEKSSDNCFRGSDIDLKKTTFLQSCADPVWEEKFEFLISEKHKYLNVGVWNKYTERKQDRLQHKPERDILLGYASISLSDISLECAATVAGCFQRTFSFLPPEPKGVASRDHKLASHSGFKSDLCYGDVTLVFVHKPETDDMENIESEDEHDQIEDEQELELADVDGRKFSHDFISAHFNVATTCDFCHKKIWLKTAFQCRRCAMICHKKCFDKCRTHTICIQSTVDGQQEANDSTKVTLSAEPSAEVITTVLHSNAVIASDTVLVLTPPPEAQSINVFESNQYEEIQPKRKKSLSAMFSNLTTQSKQSSLSQENILGRNNSLAPPSSNTLAFGSRSLPGSPNHSPQPSRKCSLQENPFTLMHEDNIDLTIERVLQHHPQDEMLVSSAKELGKELHSDLPVMQRKIKLNFMISKLQAEMADEDDRRKKLRIEDKNTTDLAVKTKNALYIARSDEKTQALALLLLHYFAGLQHCNELEKEAGIDEIDIGNKTLNEFKLNDT